MGFKPINGDSGESPVDFDLTCWYLNRRRVLELVGIDALSGELRAVREMSGGDQLLKLEELVAFKDALARWIRSQKPPTLGQLLVRDEIRSGVVFTHYTDWFCKGLSQVSAALGRGKTSIAPALAYAKLDDLRQGWRIECRFHHDHLTSGPSRMSSLTRFQRLAGRNRRSDDIGSRSSRSISTRSIALRLSEMCRHCGPNGGWSR
jgi:hypothetical protein